MQEEGTRKAQQLFVIYPFVPIPPPSPLHPLSLTMTLPCNTGEWRRSTGPQRARRMTCPNLAAASSPHGLASSSAPASGKGGAVASERMKVRPACPSANLPVALYPSNFLVGSRSINVKPATAVTPGGVIFLICSGALDIIAASLSPIEHLSCNRRPVSVSQLVAPPLLPVNSRFFFFFVFVLFWLIWICAISNVSDFLIPLFLFIFQLKWSPQISTQVFSVS